MKTIEILQNSKKSMKYVNTDRPKYLENHLENAKNMQAVKLGTADAGSFCNTIMEIARNHNLDMEIARGISNRLQRVALDSKHTTGVKNYTGLPWFKLTDMLKRGSYKNTPEEEILKDIENVIQGNSTFFKKEKRRVIK